MSNYASREIHANDEGSFCEYAGTPGSATYATRLPIISANLDIPEEFIEDGSFQSRQNESRPGFAAGRAPWTLEMTVHLLGHMTTAAGALTETWLQWLLGDGLGGNDCGMVGSTIASGSSTTGFTMAASTGWAVGQICRVGEKHDGFGDGQPAVVATLPGAHAVTLLNALPGAGEVSDKAYGTMLSYPIETLGTSKRFFVGWTDSGMQFHLSGGYLAGFKPTFTPGKGLTGVLTFKGGYWERGAVTVPTSTPAMESAIPVVMSGGSLIMQEVGTATRTTISPYEMDLELDIGLEPVPSAGGKASGQYVTSFVRTRVVPTLRVTLPMTSALFDLFDLDGASAKQYQFLFGASGVDGRFFGLYMPRAYRVGPRPQPVEGGPGQHSITLSFRGREGTVLTNDLTRSAIRFAMG
jgi:hypothetical protein